MNEKELTTILNIVWFTSWFILIFLTHASFWWMLFPVIFDWNLNDFTNDNK